MNISVLQKDVTKVNTPALIVNLFEGVKTPGGATGAVDRALEGAISRLIEEDEIKGKSGELTLIHTFWQNWGRQGAGYRSGQARKILHQCCTKRDGNGLSFPAPEEHHERLHRCPRRLHRRPQPRSGGPSHSRRGAVGPVSVQTISSNR